MTHLRLRLEMDEGRIVEVTPTSFLPLTLQQLVRALEDPSASIDMEFLGTQAVIDGVPQNGQARVTMKTTFPHTPPPYALVVGGWLPMPFVTPQHFLVDRNVVSTMRSIRAHGAREHQRGFAWWTQLREGGSGLFNPLPYAYEGSHRRTPMSLSRPIGLGLLSCGPASRAQKSSNTTLSTSTQRIPSFKLLPKEAKGTLSFC